MTANLKTSKHARAASQVTPVRGTGGCPLEYSGRGCEADHSHPSSAEVKNGEATATLSHISSCCYN
jgi:hypothetical protein